MLTGDQDQVRRINKSIILNTLRLHAPISRARVANLTGLNRGTVSNIINALLDEGLVLESEHEGSNVGRPPVALSLRPDGGAVVGLEIGVDFIEVLLTNFVAESLWEHRIEISPSQSQAGILSRAEQLIDQAFSIAKERQLRPLGIGIGLPGLVNVRQGELIIAPNLKWKNVPLRLMWNQRFRLPIYIENEANLAALGEYYFGVARGIDNFIYLSSGIGLGGGVMIGGQLFRGGHGYAGEIGHIQRDPQGELCGCGRRGCWETQVGPRAVLQRVRRALATEPVNPLARNESDDLRELTFDHVVECALQGNPLCRLAMEEVGVNLGKGIADLANIFNPAVVVIGGAFSLGREILLPVLESTIASETLPAIQKDLQIRFSEHGSDACVLGAIAVVLDDILREVALV
ncbi:MAG: ROK family transcriptional regulator [Chloroflexota bacterium]